MYADVLQSGRNLNAWQIRHAKSACRIEPDSKKRYQVPGAQNPALMLSVATQGGETSK
jgi:hypothetical protein